MPVLQNVPVSSGVVESGIVQEDHEFTIAENDCVLASSEDDLDDLNVFVDERLQLLLEQGLEQLVGDESGNVGEMLGRVGI